MRTGRPQPPEASSAPSGLNSTQYALSLSCSRITALVSAAACEAAG